MRDYHQPFQPENVLKRAGELIKVDQSVAALEYLYYVLVSKRLANDNPAMVLNVMHKFVDLCIEHRRGKELKDGLIQFRNIVQQRTPESMASLVDTLLAKITKYVTDAQKDAAQANIALIDDLEETASPEDLILGAVSGEQSKDRTDRALVTPWLKFLWEVYRNLLDILRNNARFETLYQAISNQAIDFCQKYERKTEFRRLCEVLRNHLQSAAKYAHQQNAINLSNPDTIQLFLDTHFHQLNTAAGMELWQETYRSIEDIHRFIQQSKRPIKPQAMANYFEKLTRIMYVAKNPLFLAAAWHRYYNYIHLQTKVFSEEELQNVANNVLLSTLAVPIIKPSSRILSAQAKENKHRTQRFTNLLFLSSAPTRVSLINDLSNGDILDRVRPEMRPLYDLVEEQFHPLSICKKISPILSEQIANSAGDSKYGVLLCNVILTRLLQQLSQVYTSVQLDFIFRLAQFPEPYSMSSSAIERFIMNGARRGEFQLRVDHQSRSVVFDTDPFDGSQSSSNGAQLQASPSDLMRSQLSSLAICLSNAQRVACPQYVSERHALKTNAIARALKSMEEEHRVAISRKLVIDKRKDIIEDALTRKTREEARERTIRMQREQELERQRQAEDQRRREVERAKKEIDAIRLREAKLMAESLKEKAGIVVDIDDIENLDTDKLKDLQRKQLEKEKQDMKTRLKQFARRSDYTERAYRQMEKDLVLEDYERQKREDRENHEKANKQMAVQWKEKHELDMVTKKRMERMYQDFTHTRKQLDQGRSDLLLEERKRARESLAKAKQERIEEYHQLKAEKEKRQKEQEEKAREEEEKKRKKAEEMARLREELAAQRAKDEEMLKKRLEQENQAPKKYVPPSRREGGGSKYVPPSRREGASQTSAPAPAPTKKYIPPSLRNKQ